MAYFRDKSTAAVAISKLTDALPDCALISVRIHLGSASATSENLVISVDSAAGAEYDQILDTQDMNTLQDYSYVPTVPIPLFAGDKIKVTWTNTNTETYGLEIVWQK